jgi:glycosyltransferase involved in cell wall biosynthesis
MKVGVYFPGLFPEEGGGHTFEQEILHSLLELSAESRHAFVLYFSPGPTGTTGPLPAAKNLESKWLDPGDYFPTLRRVISRVARRLGLRQWVIDRQAILQSAMERDKVQMAWFPTYDSPPVEIPYIASVCDIQHRLQPWFPEVSQRGEWNCREEHYSRLLRMATYIITPNQTGQDELSLFYQIPTARFRRLRHPVPRKGKSPSKEEIASVLEKYHISSQYILYPAQFWAHKNHINLLIAFAILRNKYKLDLDLVLTGSDQGNLQYVQEAAENLRLKEKVHFPGFVPRDDLIALYARAFALTYVTYFGPENLPPLEAFASGCPVIASNVAGAAEQLGDAALLVDGSRPEEIAMAVKKIHDDPRLRESLIQKGLVRAGEYTGLDYLRDVFKMLDEFEIIRSNWPQETAPCEC